ncbi:MAG: anhydro-N-acetylmuramic acid kinase, partial [Pedobacter sp.]
MNKNINDLYSIAAKDERIIIGLMSGTSMDGLDIAVCSFKGHGATTEVNVKHFVTAPYTESFRRDIKAIFSRRDADLQAVCIMNAVIGTTHADLINNALKEWGVSGDSIDI